MQIESLTVTPVSFWRRAGANFADVVVAALVLMVVASFMERGPPPTGMSFYTEQDFINYFRLLLVAFSFPFINTLLTRFGPWGGSFGQGLCGIRLVSFSGGEVSLKALVVRFIRTMFLVALITIPGPLIALIVGVLSSALLHESFTTADELLRRAGLPDLARWSIHSLSFIALLAALWFVIVRPVIRMGLKRERWLSWVDRWTKTTYVARS